MSEQPKRPKGKGTAVTYPERVTYYDSEEGIELLRELARLRGMPIATYLRFLVREEAKREGLKLGGGD